ncbi:La protein like protein [Daldinia childiae]|uniref:La protein like protein n=1 Tax=Daldinia childiae TaxID=326645 RepID=UPI0014460FA2|nr:La protein like protein [Daldinia childiae]KAF3061944.1 La protein like protein [Daldinia childiae]
MSDQVAKPDEGMNSDVLEVKVEEVVDTSVEAGEETKTTTQDAPAVEEQENTDVVKAEKDTAEGEMETKASEDASSVQRPKEMLKVNRKGCETRQKSDASILPDSDNPHEIRKQVEFYFSDSNLPGDKFLWSQTDGSNNKPVPLSVICNFSRMRRFKPYSAVIDALKASKHLVVEGSEGEETIRRKHPYKPADDRQYQIDERSAYVKGFGEEQSSTQFDIEAFLAQYGEFNSVRLRRADDEKKSFKGSVFVEWADKDTLDKFMALEPKPLWKDHALEMKTKLDYKAFKAQEIRAGRIPMKGSNHFGRSQRGHRGGDRGRGSRGNYRGSDANDWKKRRDEDQRNGFEDRRGRRDHRGRGRGRGNNNRGRGRDRAQNDNSRSKEQDRPVSRDDGRPKINTSKESEKIMKEENAKSNTDAQANGKRARDGDSTDTPPAKKVDTKEAVADAA